MSTDAKDTSRRFYEEIINQKNVDAIDRFCAADFVDHNPPPGGKGSLDATKQQFLELAAAFPDLKMIVQDQIAEGDRVVNRVLVRGTHKGEYMGIPGSGKTVEIGGIDILRMVNGKAAERWGYFDDVRLMQQLGAMPGPRSTLRRYAGRTTKLAEQACDALRLLATRTVRVPDESLRLRHVRSLLDLHITWAAS